jgi:NitT/TauT family transport system substrate-binding protein
MFASRRAVVLAWMLCQSLVLSGACAGPTPAAPKPAAAPPSTAPAAAPTAAAPAPTAAVARPRLRVAYVSPIGAMAPLWMAQESGAFERAGVPVEVRYIQANAAVPALLANEVEVLEISGPAVLSAALQGADLTFVAGGLNAMILNLHAAADIHSGADLRGKLVGTDRPGTPVAFGADLALQHLGLRADDVQLLNVGSADNQIAALLAGQLSASIMGPPQSFVAESAGYPMLVDLHDVPYQNVGVVARRERLDELAPSLVPFLGAYREGIERYDADKPFAMSVLQKYSQETDPEVLDKTYEFYHRLGFTRSLAVSEPGLASILGFLSEVVPEAKTAQPAQFYDARFVQQLP